MAPREAKTKYQLLCRNQRSFPSPQPVLPPPSKKSRSDSLQCPPGAMRSLPATANTAKSLRFLTASLSSNRPSPLDLVGEHSRTVVPQTVPRSYIVRSPGHLQLCVLGLISTELSPSGKFTIHHASRLLFYFIWREGLLTRNYFLIRGLRLDRQLALLEKPFVIPEWWCSDSTALWIPLGNSISQVPRHLEHT